MAGIPKMVFVVIYGNVDSFCRLRILPVCVYVYGVWCAEMCMCVCVCVQMRGRLRGRQCVFFVHVFLKDRVCVYARQRHIYAYTKLHKCTVHYVCMFQTSNNNNKTTASTKE